MERACGGVCGGGFARWTDEERMGSACAGEAWRKAGRMKDG